MSTLTQLSDDELDEVTGGFVVAIHNKVAVASNVNLTAQSQTNVGILQLVAANGGYQANSTGQNAVAVA